MKASERFKMGRQLNFLFIGMFQLLAERLLGYMEASCDHYVSFVVLNKEDSH